ncbi:MAG: CoA pyrophosphatase [Cytophagales bacterium]|nr:MAG: CoA pyrophosphatase [Cytophagales bacterium]
MSDLTIYSSIITNLEGKLKENNKLPGVEAHKKMAPPGRFSENPTLYKPNKDTRVGSVLILLYPDENNIVKFPLILRPEYDGVHSGQVALPGGKKDEEDVDLVAVALRETWEEIGVEVTRNEVIGQLSEIYIPPSNFLVYPTVAKLDHKPNFIPSPHEVAGLFEVSIDTLIDQSICKEKWVEFRGSQVLLPYFDINDNVVWGATAMILCELKELLSQ